MPFNSWYLQPAALNECTIGITGALLKIEINIKVGHIKLVARVVPVKIARLVSQLTVEKFI